MTLLMSSHFTPTPTADTLVVLLHGSTGTAHSLHDVQAIVKQALPTSDQLCPSMPMQAFSFVDPQAIVQDLLVLLDEAWQEKKKGGVSYRRVLLIGHSAGALLARKLYVCACGEQEAAPFQPVSEADVREWAPAVERLILLAGMNRGWSIVHNLPLRQAISFRVGALLGELCLLAGYQPLLFQLRRGAPFITNLRIQWLSMRRKPPQNPHLRVIQLLGSTDDIVSPDDNVDMVTGNNFVYLDMPMSGHANVIEMDERSEAGAKRKERFVAALTADEAWLRENNIEPVDANGGSPAQRNDVQEVVFVIHGIRDYGFWTHKIAQKVKKLGLAHHRIYETETSSYGYFAMLPFLLFRTRRAKVEWLMDQYTEDLALYPQAKFSFVGHSNGTYLLAKAMEEYPACRFKHVVFAGSVVRTQYPWKKFLIEEKRVERVLNYVATADWVVAFFPKVFQIFGWQDLGSAGHDGFAAWPNQTDGALYQVKYVKGSHNAALQEKYWDEIAQFIVEGTLTDTPVRDPQGQLIKRLSQAAPLLWLLLLLLVVTFGWFLLKLAWPEWAKPLVLVSYLALLWRIVTRF